jgi:hypothetical protein
MSSSQTVCAGNGSTRDARLCFAITGINLQINPALLVPSSFSLVVSDFQLDVTVRSAYQLAARPADPISQPRGSQGQELPRLSFEELIEKLSKKPTVLDQGPQELSRLSSKALLDRLSKAPLELDNGSQEFLSLSSQPLIERLATMKTGEDQKPKISDRSEDVHLGAQQEVVPSPEMTTPPGNPCSVCEEVREKMHASECCNCVCIKSTAF